MTKVTKALLVAFGSAGLVGTGFAAWNITISGGTSANRTVTPNTDGDVVLVARGLLVSDVATSLTFHADTGTQVATYNVKAEDSDWYDNVDLLDASEEKVSLKVSFAGDSDTHEWSNYIALTEAVERTYSPSEWLEGKSSSGLDVSFTFNWVGLGVYANPKAYAQATYPTVESQQAYLEAVSAAIEGLQFTFSFDLVANEPVTPPSPSVESVSATLSSASIEVGQTSTLTVNTNLANNVSGYSIVEDSGIPAVASFENGVFTGVSAGEVRFKVEIDSVKSSEVVLTVSEPAPVASITSVSVSPSEAEIEVGGNTTLTASVVKVGEISEAVTWSSDAEGVATVENGVVTGVAAGTAHITATSVADGTKSGSATITVVAAQQSAVVTAELDVTSLAKGESATLTVEVDDVVTAASDYTIVDKSDNFDTLVDYADGVLTAKTGGTATFKVQSSGSKSSLLTLKINVDKLVNSNTVKGTTTNYSSWTATDTTGAEFAGQSAGSNGTIQLRSNNSNSGIVVTAGVAGKHVAKIIVEWGSATTAGRIINVFGNNNAYTNPTDLYSSGTQGTQVGSINVNDATELTISDEYAYVGIRSSSGTLYLDSIRFVWEDND